MDDNELREMDVKVHKALYPALEPELLDGYWYCRKPGSFSMTRVPCYTTDLSAWEPIYALRPEWEWHQDERIHIYSGVSVQLYVSNWAYPKYECFVYWHEVTGLAAYALGRARCVIAWAAGRGEG